MMSDSERNTIKVHKNMGVVGMQNDKQQSVKRKKTKLKDYLKLEMYIIDTNSKWKAIFDTFVLFVVAYSIFTTLLYVSFDPAIPESVQKIDLFVFYVFSTDFVLSKSDHPHPSRFLYGVYRP
jgi:hypothetical protein